MNSMNNCDWLITITSDYNRNCAIGSRISFDPRRGVCLRIAIALINIKSHADVGIADKAKSPDDFFEATRSVATEFICTHSAVLILK